MFFLKNLFFSSSPFFLFGILLFLFGYPQVVKNVDELKRQRKTTKITRMHPRYTPCQVLAHKGNRKANVPAPPNRKRATLFSLFHEKGACEDSLVDLDNSKGIAGPVQTHTGTRHMPSCIPVCYRVCVYFSFLGLAPLTLAVPRSFFRRFLRCLPGRGLAIDQQGVCMGG